jgi:hypothetical protein
MLDWKEFVRDHMPLEGIPESIREEVVAEIATHLEDASSGSALAEFGGVENPQCSLVRWKHLARAIERAKCKEEPMNNRCKSLWVPALINITLAATLLLASEKLRFYPDIRVGHSTLFPVAWLATLPICGAAGTLLSRRAHGSLAARLIAGLAPCLVWLGVFSIMGLAFAFAWPIFREFSMSDFGLSALCWVILPALCLSPGMLPFLRKPIPD